MVQISAFRGHLRLVLLYDKGQLNEQEVQTRFVAPFVAELQRITGAPSLPDSIAVNG